MRAYGVVWLGPLFLAGMLAVQWLPRLPPREWIAGASAVAALLAWRFPSTRCVAIVVLGMAWASWCGSRAMDARLPHELEGQDLVVTGTVDGLPQVRGEATRFVLRVEQASLTGKPVAMSGLVRLAWYAAGDRGAPAIEPCTRWRLRLRLKRPRGLVNPGGSDGERSALERGIVAAGYVREDPDNQRLDASYCIDGWRASIASDIARLVGNEQAAALLRAFAVGDTRGLDREDWTVARANGASHLIAISGFHVGVAAVAGVGLARLLYLLFPRLGLRAPRRQAEALASLAFAAAYSALAGFGLPTVRTLLMIGAIAWARCLRRQATPVQSLAIALSVILLADPLAVLSAGFWLSFAGVGFLMLCLSVQGRGWRRFLRELLLAQAVMAAAMMPLALWFFGETSVTGIVSNLVAVPFVSFLVIPLTLAGTALLLLAPPLAGPVLVLAGRLIEAQWWLFERMAEWPGAHGHLPDVRPWALGMALLGAAWLFLPRGLPMRWLGAVLFLPLVWPPVERPGYGGFRMWMLDVGQGLAVVLRTHGHALVFDAGARFPSDFDMGEAAVLPSVRALGLPAPERLIVSHADNDHAGGMAAVAAAYPSAAILAGEPERTPVPAMPCTAGQTWTWDGVRFRMLGPRAGAATASGNDRSCVLLVEGRAGRALLTGDIGIQAESGLAEAVGEGTPLVLQVPHHGSRTSSGRAFVHGLSPLLALVSAGWRNRFGHPHPLVVERYAAFRVPLLNTAELGAIEVDFPADGPPRVTRSWRAYRARYWRE